LLIANQGYLEMGNGKVSPTGLNGRRDRNKISHFSTPQ